jgi:plasmid stabilization system protein ParE
VTHVELSATAVEDLDRMIVTHSLPPNTRARVQRSLRILEQFPAAGRQLEGPWEPLRFVLGPWRWLVLVYVHDEQQDVVFVLTIQDVRSSTAVTHLTAPR